LPKLEWSTLGEFSKADIVLNSHFDERLFYSELMGPIASEFGKSDILSPLTLALLDDSGWYQVNYDSFSGISVWFRAQAANS
jgi:hypothetical protein